MTPLLQEIVTVVPPINTLLEDASCQTNINVV